MTGTIAVVGAGMAGAACAAALAEAGSAVRLLDKGRSVGGRMAQRRTEAGVFDHGAQYLSAQDGDFAAAVERWRQQGVVADWPGVSSGAGRPVSVGVPAMSAPVKALLGELPVRIGCRVTALAHGDAGWTVRGEGESWAGPFAALMLAVPASQAIALLATAGLLGVGALVARLGGVRMAPCWAAMAAFAAPLPIMAPALRAGGDLVWAAQNGSKPGRGGGETWTLHAGPDWSRERLEARPDEIAPELLALLAQELGGPLPEASWLQAHRWRYALVERPLGEPCLWDPALRLGLCGDWCLGPRVESAWLSGRALAAALAKDGVAG